MRNIYLESIKQNQPQPSKNIADADFGPPLGARGKPKGKKQGETCSLLLQYRLYITEKILESK